jgi:hypothetical protein
MLSFVHDKHTLSVVSAPPLPTIFAASSSRKLLQGAAAWSDCYPHFSTPREFAIGMASDIFYFNTLEGDADKVMYEFTKMVNHGNLIYPYQLNTHLVSSTVFIRLFCMFVNCCLHVRSMESVKIVNHENAAFATKHSLLSTLIVALYRLLARRTWPRPPAALRGTIQETKAVVATIEPAAAKSVFCRLGKTRVTTTGFDGRIKRVSRCVHLAVSILLFLLHVTNHLFLLHLSHHARRRRDSMGG